MSLLTRFRCFLWYFGRVRVPLIGILKPRLISLTDQRIVVKIPLRRLSKNHLNSMYFGALAIGADVAGGLHGFYHARLLGAKVSLAFRSCQAHFKKRPESDVYFVCNEGDLVRSMIIRSQTSGERINQNVAVTAFTHYPDNAELVAEFTLELSVKVLRPA